MRIVIQRVNHARVIVGQETVGKINKGILVFLGVAKNDQPSDVDFLVDKIAQLRIFEDAEGKMNVPAREAGAEFLVVSQFTLLGDCRKGRRPSFDDAAEPRKGEEFYNLFVEKLKNLGFKVETGRFRARMDVELVNDGPVTFVIDSF